MQIRTVRDLGSLVREARREAGLSQAGLAARIGVGREWVVRLEQGHPRLEAQLVLDALDASGIRLAAAPADETDADDSGMERSSRLDSLLDSHVDRSQR